MTTTTRTTFQAHIVTHHAEHIGEPGVIVMERTDGIDSAVATMFKLGFYAELTDYAAALEQRGWTVVATDPQTPGYYVASVTR